MNIRNITTAVAAAAILLITSCNYQEEDDLIASRRSREAIEHQEQSNDYIVWEFIHSTSKVLYLWNEKVPGYDIQYSKYKTPEDFFESFRHEDDRFSAVINNYTEVEESFDNNFMTDGINYQLYRENETSNNVIGVVQYVYDDTPAKQAGIKRGHVIHKVNGTQLTKDNYYQLLNQTTCRYTYSTIKITDENGNPKLSYGDDLKESPDITKINMVIDPVLKTTTLVKNGRKIGYLLYDSFTSDTRTIVKAIEKLEAQQIDELVLDLRLNGGGYLSSLDTLASMLVPDGHEGDIFIKEKFNKIIDQEYKKMYGSEYNIIRFSPMDSKLNLERLIVLTSRHTASASEELISGLKPYMPVTTIGETTYGKFTSNFLINDTIDIGSDKNGIPYDQWAIYLSVASCRNAKNEMNFKNGFTPDYPTSDTYQYEPYDENDPLLAKAIELCTGSLAKSQKTQPAPLQGYIRHYCKPSDQLGLVSKKIKK